MYSVAVAPLEVTTVTDETLGATVSVVVPPWEVKTDEMTVGDETGIEVVAPCEVTTETEADETLLGM
jgi:hypothetical protein